MKYTFRLVVFAIVILAAGPAALAAGTLSGVVRTAGGPGVKGSVRLTLSRGGLPVADQFVAADGRFRFDGIEAGPYEMSVEAVGYESTTLPMTVLGNHLDLVIELRSRDYARAAGHGNSRNPFQLLRDAVKKLLGK